MLDFQFNQTPLTVVLAGATGGIGQALLKQLLAMPNCQRVYALSRGGSQHEDARVVTMRCDLSCESDLNVLLAQLKTDAVGVNLLINATGLLHGTLADGTPLKPEKALTQVSLAQLQASFNLNAFANILLLQAVLPFISSNCLAWIVNLSARVGSIEDNRLGGWYSYRAAKAAQNQLFKTAAIELKRSHPHATCLQLHPGTVDSNLSKPFQRGVPDGQLFTAAQSAAYLLAVVASKTPADSGTFWDWNNTVIPW